MWLPPKVSRELVDERHQFARTLQDNVIREKMLHVKGLIDEATYRLRQTFGDDRLEVVRAADTVASTSPLKPGYYAVIRWNEDAPPTVINIEGPDGEFVDLDGHIEAVVRMMHNNNMRDREVRERIMRHREEREKAAECEKARDNAERREELRDRLNAATRTSVSMNPDTPWTQNASPHSRRDAGARRRKTGS
jgi:hypothetical protein